MTLRIFAITKPGMVALAASVAALWMCVGYETITRRQSDRELAASLRTLTRLKRRTRDSRAATPVRGPALSIPVRVVSAS